MDLGTVTSFRRATTRGDLRLEPGEALLGGGTWLFSEPQVDTSGLVDLTTLGWTPWEVLDDGSLRIAATCTIAELLAVPDDVLGAAHALVRACAEAFLMSFKIQHVATVGGNLCLALPAGAMISLATGLGGEAVVWTPDGAERREPVGSFVRGVGATSLAAGEVLRAVDLPAASLEHRTAMRRASLAPYGRSSALVVARRTPDALLVVITAATTRPVVLELSASPTDGEVAAAIGAVDCWHTDHHGAADWRAAVTGLLATEACEALR